MEPELNNRAMLEANLERQLQWIAAADGKISPVLALDTAMLGALAAFTPAPGDWTLLAALLTATSIVLLCISIVNLFLAGFPRTTGPTGSLIFFGGVTQRTERQFLEDVAALSETDYLRDLAKQCYRNAEIAGAKYHHVKIATTYLLWCMIPWALGIYVMYGNS